MDSIPFEMLILIFKKLDLNDLLSCRLVSRKWMLAIKNNNKIKFLSVKRLENKTIKQLNGYISFSTDNRLFFQAELIRSILANLKQLHIDFSPYFDLN